MNMPKNKTVKKINSSRAKARIIMESQDYINNVFTIIIRRGKNNVIMDSPLKLLTNKALMEQLSRQDLIRVALLAGIESMLLPPNDDINVHLH